MRVFVAAELPAAVARALVRWTPEDPALRPVAREALHLTLAFLGERSDDEVARVREVLPPLARPVGDLSLGDVRPLPPRRPRVLAVEVVDAGGALGALQRDVVAALAAAIGLVPERRQFLAHVTVARVRSGARPGRLPAAAPAVPGFGATALTLFRSRLSPHGARYDALERTLL